MKFNTQMLGYMLIAILAIVAWPTIKKFTKSNGDSESES